MGVRWVFFGRWVLGVFCCFCEFFRGFFFSFGIGFSFFFEYKMSLYLYRGVGFFKIEI